MHSSGLLFKSDKYRKDRGGHSRWLALYCEKCGDQIAIYQKDGPGILKRLYVDRIVNLKNIVGKNLTCKECRTILGVWITYKKEKRPAYRLFVGAVGKKIIKGSGLQKLA